MRREWLTTALCEVGLTQTLLVQFVVELYNVLTTNTEQIHNESTSNPQHIEQMEFER